jgi:hypothetical protein
MSHPSRILILRHGEKPTSGPYLSMKGYERSGALAWAIPAVLEPDDLFATKPSEHSNRPVETLTPLADRLNADIDEDYQDDDYDVLAELLLTDEQYAHEKIVICWHHGHIPALAAALGATDAPDTWDEAVFDRFWLLIYEKEGKVKFLDLPQRLLFGDSER